MTDESYEGYPPDPPDNAIDEGVSLPFVLEYDGPGYAGEMSALRLSTVLQGLDDYGHALQATGALGADTKVRTIVRDFDEGSFDFTALVLILGVVRDVALIAATLGTGFGFWWRHMRRNVTGFIHLAEHGTVQVNFGDGESLELTEAQWKLLNDQRARKAIGKITSPLRDEGVTLTVTTPWDDHVTYTHDDAVAFEEPVQDAPPPERRTVLAYPETVSFDPGKAWRLWTSTLGSFSARIEDVQFVIGVDAGSVRVGKTDSFTLALRIEEGRHDGDRPRYFIERVIEHTAGAEQHGLPGEAS